ncbi:MAG: hypothetical protein FJ148_01825 [Deltaproteobacteria bacterium]|nr:hypothetical protein [Deltaproteobacteria bacterium]
MDAAPGETLAIPRSLGICEEIRATGGASTSRGVLDPLRPRNERAAFAQVCNAPSVSPAIGRTLGD